MSIQSHCRGCAPPWLIAERSANSMKALAFLIFVLLISMTLGSSAGYYAHSGKLGSDESYLVVLSGLDSHVVVDLKVVRDSEGEILVRKVCSFDDEYSAERLSRKESARLLEILRGFDWAEKPSKRSGSYSTIFPMRVRFRASGEEFWYREIEADTDLLPSLRLLNETVSTHSFRPGK